MKRRVLVTIAFLLVVMALAALPFACTDGETTPTNTSTTTINTSTTTTTQTTTPDEPSVTHPELNRTTADKLKEMLDTMKVSTDFVIVDTRDGGTYTDSHIQGAINISYSPDGDPFEQEMMYMVLPMSKPVVIYCG